MKIGMLTFHRALNIGANLQAYALNRYIIETIGNCEIIDFFPNSQKREESPKKLLSFAKTIAVTLINRKVRKFRRFQKKCYRLSPKQYYGDSELKAHPLQYDVLLSGSDQILNTKLSGGSESYYLTFNSHVKKISYASSFGRTELSEQEYHLIDTELPKFFALSVREESAGEIIYSRTGRQAELVVDPVFLLSREEWIKMGTKVKVPGQYIFVYAMEVTEQLKKAVGQMAQHLALPVLVLYGGSASCGIDGKIVEAASPQEFITYINRAALVVTNSFHGAAFSLILQKRFVCVAHSSRNVRLQNLLRMIEQNKMVTDLDATPEIDDYIINGEIAFSKMKPYIEKSKRYLQKNIG